MPVEIEHDPGDPPRLALRGTLDAAGAVALLRALKPLLRGGGTATVDLAGVRTADSAGVAALAEALHMAHVAGGRVQVTGAGGQVREALSRAPAPAPGGPALIPRPPMAERAGAAALEAADGFTAFLQLLADTFHWTIIAPLRRRFPPPGSVTQQALRIGADAVPIVSLIAFLLGLILAFQAAYQLRQFGANIFVANLVGIAVVREMGPLMTAIVVAGRSGSSIAAELGTMVVGEEVDALRVMGIEPIRFLVVPRIVAITFTQPALTLYANAVGIFGGFVIALFYLDLSAAAYINQTIEALSISDLLTGLAKSLCFAWIIALTGCHCGLRITGGAEGVGRATTTSVVASIFSIIATDGVFTTLSTVLG